MWQKQNSFLKESDGDTKLLTNALKRIHKVQKDMQYIKYCTQRLNTDTGNKYSQSVQWNGVASTHVQAGLQLHSTDSVSTDWMQVSELFILLRMENFMDTQYFSNHSLHIVQQTRGTALNWFVYWWKE